MLITHSIINYQVQSIYLALENTNDKTRQRQISILNRTVRVHLVGKVDRLNSKTHGVGGGGAWVVQLVKHQMPGFSSGCNLRVVGLSPMSGFLICRA